MSELLRYTYNTNTITIIIYTISTELPYNISKWVTTNG